MTYNSEYFILVGPALGIIVGLIIAYRMWRGDDRILNPALVEGGKPKWRCSSCGQSDPTGSWCEACQQTCRTVAKRTTLTKKAKAIHAGGLVLFKILA